MRFEVEVDAVSAIGLLRKLQARGEDPRPALKVIADDFYHQVDATFASEGRTVDRPWKPLNAAYRRSRIKAGKGVDILRIRSARGGILHRSLTGQSRAEHVRRITRDEMVLGTRLGIAKIHQEGGVVSTPIGKTGRRRNVTIPARPFVVVNDATERRWRHILNDYLAADTSGRAGIAEYATAGGYFYGRGL